MGSSQNTYYMKNREKILKRSKMRYDNMTLDEKDIYLAKNRETFKKYYEKVKARRGLKKMKKMKKKKKKINKDNNPEVKCYVEVEIIDKIILMFD